MPAIKGEGAKFDRVPLGRRFLMYAVMLMIVLVVVEAGSFIVIHMVKSDGVFYDPAMVTQNYQEYLVKRDSELGWRPHPSATEADADDENTASDGTRSDPVFPITATPCVSLFGDSFTWSAQVADRDTWGSVLAGKLKCRVANYGVNGYGTDQAYLRFRSLPRGGGVVFLNHLSENILRNVNQFRNLLYPGDEFALKPRFIVRSGAVELVPIPQIAPPEIRRFLREPALFLHHEYFLPGGLSGIQAISFPFSGSVLEAIFQNYHIRAKLANVPRYMDFYRRGHPSGGLEVTDGILRAFAGEAAARGQVPIVTFVPTCRDLVYVNTNGVLPYEQLRKMIAGEGIRYIDFGERIAKRTQGSSPHLLYHDCSGHLNEAGNRLLAEIAYEYIHGDPEIERRLAAER